ncbi:MAG: hypothetical protein JWM04_1551 [Verrucomicrobiales bacterium]|jgi:hypothetical protein|nr:hypothetical protein [Verrucomicrobiales bacterium]
MKLKREGCWGHPDARKLYLRPTAVVDTVWLVFDRKAKKPNQKSKNFTTMNAQQTEKKAYETPTLVVVGAIIDTTLGGGGSPTADTGGIST